MPKGPLRLTATGARALMAVPTLLGLLAAVSCYSAPAFAEDEPPAVRQYRSLALSPSADQIAVVETSETGAEVSAPHARIVVRGRSGAILQVSDPCLDCRYAGLSFSPRGDALAFIASDSKTSKASLEVLAGGKVRTLVVVDGVAQTPRWSPDGSRLAVLATVGAHKEVGATQAGRALTGEIGSDIDEQRIGVASVSGGALRLVSPADTWVYEYGWTADGQGFVATASKGDGDDNWWIAKLYYYDETGGASRLIAAPNVQINAPSVSPDGRFVAFIGGLMSDFGSVGGDLFLAPLSGGEPRNLTPKIKATVTGFEWRGSALLATTLMGAGEELQLIDPATGKAEVALALPIGVSLSGSAAFSADGETTAFVSQSFTTAPQIEAGAIARPLPVTHENDHLSAHVQAKSLSWSTDGFDVQGWLLSPAAVESGKTHPMITVVHGGPSAAATPYYVATGIIRDLLDRGYFIFEPNPRGSYGQGEAFTAANVRDLGGGDLRDILQGVDAAEKIAPIDDRRLGVYGHSYGGFMSMWTVTHTDRFQAAVAGAGIADWVSYYGQNGIDKWMIPFFGASAYDDPSIYDKLSPIRYIKAAKTPTFIYVGERDVECPAAQSLEFWHGLRAMGVPNSLVVYEGEGHGIRKPEHVQDLNRRIVSWFDQHLGP